MVGHVLAWTGDPSATAYIDKVAELNPGEASMLLAFLRSRQGRFTETAVALESAYISLRTDPWVMAQICKKSFDIAHYLASTDPSGAVAVRLFRALEQPFSVYAFEEDRRKTLPLIGVLADRRTPGEYTRKAIESFEPNIPWDRQFLQVRRDCYRALGDPRAAQAERDLAKFMQAEPQPIEPAGESRTSEANAE